MTELLLRAGEMRFEDSGEPTEAPAFSGISAGLGLYGRPKVRRCANGVISEYCG